MPRSKTTKPDSAPELLKLEYVPLATALHWERNPKRHDHGAICQSFKKHGFKDPPKFEPKLNGGRGGMVEGNGRTHVLREMKNAGESPPRGVLATKDDWFIPVLFGVDAESERAAESYGVDHNNLVMHGGDFSAYDVSKLWDETAYAALLTDMAQFDALPVSVDGDDVDALIESIARGSANGGADGGSAGSGTGSGHTQFEQTQRISKSSPGAPKDERYKEQYAVIVICEGESHQQEVYERLRDEGYEVKVVST
jgi:hypothetical protein